jgi:prepilin-type N-terminal cleavage/methylation domain-containing protein
MFRKRANANTRERGFSLTEMMVVLAIISILLAIAVPTMLGPKRAAQDVAAQTRLVAALKTEEVYATDGGSYTSDQVVLEGLESSLEWGNANDDAVRVLVASVAETDDAVLLYTKSTSGTWFGLRNDRTGALTGRHTCAGGAEGDVDDMTDCTGDDW